MVGNRRQGGVGKCGNSQQWEAIKAPRQASTSTSLSRIVLLQMGLGDSSCVIVTSNCVAKSLSSSVCWWGDGGEKIWSCAICRPFSVSTLCWNPPYDSFLGLIGSSAELTSPANQLANPLFSIFEFFKRGHVVGHLGSQYQTKEAIYGSAGAGLDRVGFDGRVGRG